MLRINSGVLVVVLAVSSTCIGGVAPSTERLKISEHALPFHLEDADTDETAIAHSDKIAASTVDCVGGLWTPLLEGSCVADWSD